MIIESGGVSMGTCAPLPPEVFVVVDSVGTLIAVRSRARRVALLSRVGKRLDEVHLVAEMHKPPVEQRQGDPVCQDQLTIPAKSEDRSSDHLIPLPRIKYHTSKVAFWSYGVSQTVSLQP